MILFILVIIINFIYLFLKNMYDYYFYLIYVIYIEEKQVERSNIVTYLCGREKKKTRAPIMR